MLQKHLCLKVNGLICRLKTETFLFVFFLPFLFYSLLSNLSSKWTQESQSCCPGQFESLQPHKFSCFLKVLISWAFQSILSPLLPWKQTLENTNNNTCCYVINSSVCRTTCSQRQSQENVICNIDQSVKQVSISTFAIHHKTQSNTDDDENYSFWIGIGQTTHTIPFR